MITKIDFPDLAKSKTFSYAAKVDFFKKNTGVEFKPGLNILYGPNGCGKSTILRMIALTLAAEQGGVSTITQSWISDVMDFDGKTKLEGFKVHHDGQPLMYGNPRNTIGLIGGGAAFDDDFMSEGLANIQSKASTGYTTINRLGKMLVVMSGTEPFPSEISDRTGEWSKTEKYSEARKLLVPSETPRQKTFIFDEPESGLAIHVQQRIFDKLYSDSKKNDFQVIIATHSVFALHMPGANYIEMQDDYLEHTDTALQILRLRRDIAVDKAKL